MNVSLGTTIFNPGLYLGDCDIEILSFLPSNPTTKLSLYDFLNKNSFIHNDFNLICDVVLLL
jgi:hypothetical protein